jgi:hypothetical protein
VYLLKLQKIDPECEVVPNMRTSVDIPDSLYREMKLRVAIEGTTIKKIILEGLMERLHKVRPEAAEANQTTRPKLPVIESRAPGSLRLGEEGVYEYIPFP